jgi:drug/metabolite transporter (DMT)-like permease
MSQNTKASHWGGVAMNIGAAMVYSTAGLFTRILTLDVWTLLFWRGIFAGLVLFGILLAKHRRRTGSVLRRLGGPGVVVVLASTAGMILYIHALRQTAVADVAVIYAASPFVTAALSWIWMGEGQDKTTMIASLVALSGVLVMIGGGLGNGHLLGDALALGMTVCMAVTMIAISRYPRVPMVGAACLSSVLTTLCVWPFASPWDVTATDLGKLVLFGSQLGIGQLLLTLGTRLVPATVSALIGTLDAPLAPLWVWAWSDEVPSWQTVLGGAIVLAGVLARIFFGRPGPAGLSPDSDPAGSPSRFRR